MNVIHIAILGLRKVTGVSHGVAIVTQPLTAIMTQKMKSKDVKTAILSMAGQLKSDGDEDEDAELDCLESDILDGKFPVIIGHPESWGSRRGQRLLMEMMKRKMIILVGTGIKHINTRLIYLMGF